MSPTNRACTACVLWFLFNQNIRKYLLTEAREKNRPEFLQGWQTAVTKCIPQQKNDSDCGVFVLQYCKCLALEQPFQFSQEDMPRVRKRIYKELCECRLLDWDSLSRDSRRRHDGADGLLLESPNTYWIFTDISDWWYWATYCYLRFIFALHSLAIMYFFLMFNLVSFLTLWIPYVPPIFNIYYPNACI